MTSPDEPYDDWTMAEDDQAAQAALEAESEADRALREDLTGAAGYDGGVARPGPGVNTRSILGTVDGLPTYEVTNDDGAQWALRILKRAQVELDRVAGAVERERARLKGYETRATAGPKATIEKMTALLVDYRLKLEAEDPKLPKTYRLPSGDIVRRAGAAKVDVYHEAEFIEWAVANDLAAVNITPRVSTLRGNVYRTAEPEKDVKKLASKSPTGATAPFVSPDGEVVPGVQLYVPPDSYGAKPR